MKLLLTALLGATGLFNAATAVAAPVTVEYTGKFGYICRYTDVECINLDTTDAPGFAVNVGDTVTGRFTYDTALQLSPGSPNGPRAVGWAFHGFSQSLTFANGFTQAFNAPSSLRYETSAETTSYLNVLNQEAEFGNGPAIGALFQGPFGSGADQPYRLPAASAWQDYSTVYSEFGFSDFGVVYGDVGINGYITAFRVVAVPEPSTYAMLLVGAAAVLWRRRQAAR